MLEVILKEALQRAQSSRKRQHHVADQQQPTASCVGVRIPFVN
eukprot:SAG31_NODE_4685_length_3032_cov_15.682237_4_plen_43_part_00